MDNNVKVVLTSAVTSVAAMVAALTLGFGRTTTNHIHTSDGANLEVILKSVDDKFNAVSESIDQLSDLAIDITNKGSKEIRTQVIATAKKLRDEKMKQANTEAEKAMEEAKAKREAQKAAAKQKSEEDKKDVFGMRNAMA